MALYRWKPLETVTFAGGTIARRQNRVLEYRSKFIIQREYDRATRICGTEVHRGTRYVGTYEYNPVNERVRGAGREGGEEVDRGVRPVVRERARVAVSMPRVWPIRTKFDVCHPRKYEAAGYESYASSHTPLSREIIIVHER